MMIDHEAREISLSELVSHVLAWQWFFLSFAVLVMAASMLIVTTLSTATSAELRPQVRDVMASLDKNCLGCGYDAYTKTISAHPMAFAVLASTGAELNDEKLTRIAADWLKISATSTDGAVGWGLGFAWDAFGDKSINPANTVYGITTALSVTGLLDAYEATGDTSYAKIAISALDYYARFFTRTERGGYFWYSDQKADDIDVSNVSSMLMGQYARAAKLFSRRDFGDLAALAERQLMADAKSVNGARYWLYSANSDRPNDSVHAAYTVQGLVEFVRYSGERNLLNGCAEYLASFVSRSEVLEFSPLHHLPEKQAKQPARLWGVGMLIYTLNQLGEKKIAQRASLSLNSYRINGSDVLGNVPNASTKGEPRMIAHALLGLASIQHSATYVGQ